MSMLESIKKSVETHSMIRYRKQSIDAFSASAIMAVYSALNDVNKAKFAELMEHDVIKAASIAFQLCK